jgi:hypothetical protein
VRGRAGDRVNHGRLDPKDIFGWQANHSLDRLTRPLVREGGPLGLRDLQDLCLMAAECDISWTVIGQAAQGVREHDLYAVVKNCEGETATQLKWLRTRMKEAAPQALVAAS